MDFKTEADIVLGQPNFTSNSPSTSATGMSYPIRVALDRSVKPPRVYVVEELNNRILVFHNTDVLVTGAPADAVIGQPDLSSALPNRGQGFPSADSLYDPSDIDVDSSGNLYVADAANHRVLVFLSPFGPGGDLKADYVIGQPDFNTNIENNGGTSPSSLDLPLSVKVDPDGNLYVVDFYNQRALEYDRPIATDRVADRVFGQGNDFTTAIVNKGGVSANSLCWPQGVEVDKSGNVYVADTNNNRVLVYLQPLTTDTTADQVVGQGSDFTTNAPNRNGLSAGSLCSPCTVEADPWGNLYISDCGNNRILFYYSPLAADVNADAVFGQGNVFDANAPNKGGLSARSLDGPQGILVEPLDKDENYPCLYEKAVQFRLYVADCFNNRVLRFTWPILLKVCSAWITVPHTGQSVSGNAVSVIAHVTGECLVSSVQFQYRLHGTETWSDLGPVLTERPYHLKWDTTSAYLQDGMSYDLRAVAANLSGVKDPSPSFVTVTINRTNPDICEGDNDRGGHFKQQKIDPDTDNEIVLFDGTAISVPHGAVNCDGSITVTVLPDETAPSASDVKLIGDFRDFSLADGKKLSGSVTITIPYKGDDSGHVTAADGTRVSENDLKIFWFSESCGCWQPVQGSAVNPDLDIVTATVAHLSKYALFASNAAADLSRFNVYPNPFKPNDGDANTGLAATGIIFDNLTRKARVQIYTIAGELVRDEEITGIDGNKYAWNVKNGEGEDVVSGIYIYVVTDLGTSEKKIGKLAILR